MKKVILVTGASSGLGFATAKALAAQGHTVYGTSRDVKRIKDAPFRPLEMDITDDASVNKAIGEIIKNDGRIDVVVNNAGTGLAGPLYATPVEAAKRQFEVNFFGVIRVNSAVLPGMIERQSGVVIQVSSLGGLFGLPYQGLYCSSKFAIEGYSQSLRMELLNTGVKVVVVNPGDFKTTFTDNREKLPFTLTHEKLQKDFDTAVSNMGRDEQNGSHPDVVAKQICKIVAKSRPAHNYLVGALGQTIVPTLKAILPGNLFVKLMNGHYGIK
jgi:NAD(P)-dependent dehydrogenase (short-subunit alcohol dehydrogenase family)